MSAALQRLAIVGVGLIGSSLLRAARAKGLAETLIAHDLNPEVLAKARELGLADHYTQDWSETAAADLIVLCTPVGAMGAAAQALGPHLSQAAVLTDVGSVKAQVIAQVTPHLPKPGRFVAGHPIAGTERSGPEAGFAELFDGRWAILTPTPETEADAEALVEAFWQGLGSAVDRMDPEHHDLVLAITSHVPHLIAYNIVGTAADLETVTRSEVIKYSAGGFRDFTRIAASDPVMWRDIFLANKDAVLEMLARFSEDLSALQRAIRWGDGEALFDLFTRTRNIRASIVEAGQETAEPDFGRKPRAKDAGQFSEP